MRGIAAYQSTRKQTATPAQIVLMLFQTAVQRLGKLAHSSNVGSAEWVRDLHHVREIYFELRFALDQEAAPQLYARLYPLYTWSISELVRAGRDKDVRPIKNVLKTSTSMMEAWMHVAYHAGV